jgi:hypothetical protein
MAFGRIHESAIFPESCLIEPWLELPGLAMISAYCGVGKTWSVLGIGLAVASGTPFLG